MRKKLTAFILTVTTVAALVVPKTALSESGTKVYDANGDADAFIEYVSDVTQSEDEGISLFSLDEEKDEENPYNRLIVMTEADVPYYGASSVVKGYFNTLIIQYDSDEECRAAYEIYKNMSSVDSVEFDRDIELCGDIDESGAVDECADAEEDIEITVEDTAEVPSATPLSWGYGSDYIGLRDYQNEFLADKDLPNLIVAVIDSGANINHELFADRIVNPYNICTNTSTASDMLDNKVPHGTHVCGIIADGTLSNVQIMPIKIMSSSGSMSISSLNSGITRAVNYGADVINMSLGANVLYSSTTAYVNNAISEGVTVVAAAGNATINVENSSPANVSDAIAVAALDKSDSLAYYSNYGFGVDISAPGSSIYSSYYKSGNNAYYTTDTGTSMASPHIAACIANILSYSEDITREQAELLLKYNAERVDYSETKYYGDKARLTADFVFDGILIDTHHAETAEGGEIELSADTYTDGADITWASSDTSIAEVDEDGVVTAKSEGTVTITASSGDVSDECEVVVYGIGDWYDSDETSYEIDSAEELLDVAELVSSGVDDFTYKTDAYRGY